MPQAAKSRRFSHLFLRVLALLFGMFVAALGVGLTTVANLGTTPISTVPLVLARLSGLSFGMTTFLVNILLVAAQAVLLRKRFNPWNLLQIPAVFFFGAFIDMAMHMVSAYPPSGWWTGLAMSMAGNVVLAAGIVIQIRSKTIVQPGEGFVLAAAAIFHKSFGTVKIINDISLSLIAAAISLIFLGELFGVREGTVISAVLVGLFAKLIVKCFPDKSAGAPAQAADAPPEPHEVPLGDDKHSAKGLRKGLRKFKKLRKH